MNKFITLHGLSVFWEELKSRIVLQTELATVAKTGRYSDLTGKPVIPDAYVLPSDVKFSNLTVTQNLTIPGGKIYIS